MHCHPPPVARCNRHAGFTYIGLLILLAVIALVAGASVQVGAALQRRAAEEELLLIGGEFRDALQSYANATSAGQPRYPASLQELLKDPRFPNTVRHLRKIYIDPLTGNNEWGIVEPDDGHGVLAVFSLSDQRPIKVGNFDATWQGFDGSDSYRRWRFGLMPRSRPNTPDAANIHNAPNPDVQNLSNGKNAAPASEGGTQSGQHEKAQP